jgi:hypothetical protein
MGARLTPPRHRSAPGRQVVAPVGDLLERDAEVLGELVVTAVRARSEVGGGDQCLARITLSAVRLVAARFARQLPGLDVARVQDEEADEALERVAVGQRGDVRREVETFRAGDRDGTALIGDEGHGCCRRPSALFHPSRVGVVFVRLGRCWLRASPRRAARPSVMRRLTAV